MDHHDVPQFYTRRGADSTGRVLCYERVPNGHIAFDATPPAVFWENHDEHVIETEFFSPIDNDAAIVLDKLNDGASSPDGPRAHGVGARHELDAASAS